MGDRDGSVDALRALAAFMVVCIHCPFPGEVGQQIVGISRAGTVTFFIISGYYFSDMVTRHKILRYELRIFKILMLSTIFYFIVYWMEGPASFMGCYKHIKMLSNPLKVLVLNITPVSGHLWYLSALMISVMVIYACHMLKIERFLFIFAPIMIVLDEVLGKYSQIIWGGTIDFIYIRNWIFVGVPYMTIGIAIKKLDLSKRLTYKKWALLAVLFSFTNCIEHTYTSKYISAGVRDEYFSTAFLAIALSCLFHSAYDEFRNNVPMVRLADFGRKHSGLIYIFHPFVGSIITIVISGLWIENYIKILFPVVIYFTTVLWNVFYMTIEHKLRLKYENRNCHIS